MKKKLFLFCLLIFSLPAWAQEQGMFKISATANRTSFSNKRYVDPQSGAYTLPGRVVQGYGVALEFFVGDFVSLSWCLEFGNTNQGANYMRYPAGIQALPFLINNINVGSSSWVYTTLLLAITPEGIHLHLPIQEQKLYIAPYISPLGIYREKKANLPPSPALGLSIGTKFEVYSKNFTFSPYAGVRTLYNTRSGGWGIEGGLHVGMVLGD